MRGSSGWVAPNQCGHAPVFANGQPDGPQEGHPESNASPPAWGKASLQCLAHRPPSLSPRNRSGALWRLTQRRCRNERRTKQGLVYSAPPGPRTPLAYLADGVGKAAPADHKDHRPLSIGGGLGRGHKDQVWAGWQHHRNGMRNCRRSPEAPECLLCRPTGHWLHARSLRSHPRYRRRGGQKAENGAFPFLYQARTAALAGRCRKAEKHGQCFRCSIFWDKDMVV